MAHSPIMFGGGGLHIRDDFLGSILRRLVTYTGHLPNEYWLRSAAESWHGQYEETVSGCRNIRLDEWLTSDERRAEFLRAIDWVHVDLLRAIAAGDFDAAQVPFEQTFVQLKDLVAARKIDHGAGNVQERN